MSEITMQISFRTTLTAKEFSVVTRCLAGHKLPPADLILAGEINKRLLLQRLDQAREYAQQAARALEVAEAESQGLPVPENNPAKLRETITKE